MKIQDYFCPYYEISDNVELCNEGGSAAFKSFLLNKSKLKCKGIRHECIKKINNS